MRRPVSLRTRVALASALSAALAIVAMSVVFLLIVQTRTDDELDAALRSLEVVRVDGTASAAACDGRVVRLEPNGDGCWELPADLREGDRVDLGLAVPRDVVATAVERRRFHIVAVALSAIALAAALGWFFAHRSVLPLRRLTAATKDVGTRLSLDFPRRTATTETAELATAMDQMLGRIDAERRHTADALATARDFAATAAHELRTPLTSMRTDLQVLSGMELPAATRAEILADVLAAQGSLESTLSALERLALGELTTDADREEVDLDELVDEVVDDARRRHPDVTLISTVPQPIRLAGLAAGLRSVVDNAITNAIRHGGATRVEVAARRASAGTVTLTVDDDGTGVPPEERDKVFDRFYRGLDTETPGSGLGLALVAQQARLHGGTAALTDSPLGGVRLTVTLATAPRATPPGSDPSASDSRPPP
ncbi:sensor histidine kinase [Nocardia otitidiscaviarum]|uniref:sensor histidine kinase n=1 Tax=Nocardia otitidiscaviarum TaxID=1823 RepID=UPI0018955CA4|nr:HAMP domain-containing sensor histidine kinase [Nocardia otitidiscaviarum]MBF6180109.1 HAMP domain-containing histidine kinase [Nocardia otitidiscaviarum]